MRQMEIILSSCSVNKPSSLYPSVRRLRFSTQTWSARLRSASHRPSARVNFCKLITAMSDAQYLPSEKQLALFFNLMITLIANHNPSLALGHEARSLQWCTRGQTGSPTGACCHGDRLGPGLILRDCIVHFLVQVCVYVCVSLHYQSPAGWP